MGGCTSKKSKQDSILQEPEPARNHVQNKIESQFKYPDLKYQRPNNIDPSKLQQAKVSIVPSNIRPQSLLPDIQHPLNHQKAAGASKIPFAQSVANVLPPANAHHLSNLPHQSMVANHSEVPNPSNINLPHLSHLQKAVQSSNLRELPPHYSKIPSLANQENEIKIPSNVANLSNIPHPSAIPNQQQINKESEISLGNKHIPHPQQKYLSQFKNEGQIPISDNIPIDQSSINGVLVDMKSKIESEGGVVKSNIGFKQRSGVEHVFASQAVFQKNNKNIEQEQQVVNDENVQNYTIPIQNFNLSYSLAK